MLPIKDDTNTNSNLIDVLDQFSAATASNIQSKLGQPQQHEQEPIPSSSGPGRPSGPSSNLTNKDTSLPADIQIPSGPAKSESEDEFLARLTAEMSSVMSKFSQDPAASVATPDDIAKMGQELEEFTHRMEAQGIKPEDMLRAILGEEAGDQVVGVAEKERERRASSPSAAGTTLGAETQPFESSPSQNTPSAENNTLGDSPTGKERSKAKSKSKSKSKSTGSTKADKSFESTILQTLSRMENSSAAATNATQKSTEKSEEDLLAEMLRALENPGAGGAGSSGDSEGDISKMFLQMMEQLTHKSLLYEPMKELSEKYPSWLSSHKPPTLSQSEHDRFSQQRVIVDEIVTRFENKNYSDDNSGDREYIWEKMQKMQELGAPPEDLVANPFPGMGMPGLPGLGDGGLEGMEEGCPTQ